MNRVYLDIIKLIITKVNLYLNISQRLKAKIFHFLFSLSLLEVLLLLYSIMHGLYNRTPTKKGIKCFDAKENSEHTVISVSTARVNKNASFAKRKKNPETEKKIRSFSFFSR